MPSPSTVISSRVLVFFFDEQMAAVTFPAEVSTAVAFDKVCLSKVAAAAAAAEFEPILSHRILCRIIIIVVDSIDNIDSIISRIVPSWGGPK